MKNKYNPHEVNREPIDQRTNSLSKKASRMVIQPTAEVISLEEYHPPTGGRSGMLRMDFNENTIGCSPKVIQALKTIDANTLSVYPEYEKFLKKLAALRGVSADELVLTNGTDEAINVIMNAFVNSGDEVIIPVPTFAMFKFYATIAGAKVKEVLYNPDLSFPFEQVLQAINPKTKIIVLVNPNNPTGTPIPDDQIKKIIEKAAENQAIVMIDEAYYEFYGKSSIDLIKNYNNLFITRTFSKAYGLAGMRLGYIMGDAEIIAPLKKSISPYSVNTVALVCASAALDDQKFVDEYVKEVIQNRPIVTREIEKLGVKIYPSSANFVLCDFGEKCESVCTGLKKKGILVRNRTKDSLLKGCVRIGVGTKTQNEQFFGALKEVLSENKETNFWTKINQAIIFDIDGVLVDVSQSYRVAIAKTAEYFTGCVVMPEEINEFKSKTGYNNDWVLTEAIIKKRGSNAPYQKIVDKFQELYLGTNGKGGLIENEKWMLNKKILEELSKKYLIGILTGRPREEAIIPLQLAGVEKYFKVIVAMEDCEGKGKPNPFGLNLAMEKLKTTNKAGSYYIGDVPDDMRAAKNAGMIGIGSLPPQNKSEELRQMLISAGAVKVLNEVNEIIKVIK